MSEFGEQVLDLEALANHKGSMLGQIPGDEQPSHKYFCSLVTEKLSTMKY
jgi:tRNA 2-selenouridine synthase